MKSILRSGWQRAFLLPLVTLSVHALHAQESNSAPINNPFDRPSFMVELRGTRAVPIAVAVPVELELRATLVSNGRPLANINGEVLALGQSYEGHRLIYVEEGLVVLVRDGEQVTLSVYDKQIESDAARE